MVIADKNVSSFNIELPLTTIFREFPFRTTKPLNIKLCAYKL